MMRDQMPIQELCQSAFVTDVNWSDIVESGFATLCVSEQAGGFGGDALELWTVAREAGRAVLRQPVIQNAILPAWVLERAGETTLLEALIAGEVSVAVGVGELTGSVAVSGDGQPDQVMVISQGALMLAPGNVDSWEVSQRIDGWPEGKITLVQADARLIGGADSGNLTAVVSRLLGLARAAEIAGLADRAVELTGTFLGERSQFGQKLSTFQALRHRMVDMMIAAQEVHALSLRVAMALEADPDGTDSLLDGLAAKAVQVAELVGTEAVQMHGGVGTTDEYLISHIFRRLTALALVCQAPDALQRLAASEDALLG